MLNKLWAYLLKHCPKVAIIEIQGGAGNQLFQLNMACHLISIGYYVLAIDLNASANGRSSRKTVATSLLQEICVLHATVAYLLDYISRSRKLKPILQKLSLLARVSESDLDLERLKLFGYGQLVIVSGYWQGSSGNHIQIAPLIEARLKHFAISQLNSIYADHGSHYRYMRHNDYVAIHVRACDFAYTPGYFTLTANYYEEAWLALSQAKKEVTDLPVFVSTDSSDHANLVLKNAPFKFQQVFIEDPLMIIAFFSNAKYRIIANSSLTLWSAMVPANPGFTCYPLNWNYYDPTLPSRYLSPNHSRGILAI